MQYGTGEDGGGIPLPEIGDPQPVPALPDPPNLAGFDQNLAETLSDALLRKIGMDVIDDYENDKKARQKRDEQQADALRRTGFGEEAPGGASFPGASKVAHPMIGEASIDFAASAGREMLQPEGVVRAKIVPEMTRERIAKARRIERHMNWQLTSQCMEFQHEYMQMLSQLGIGGSQYMKIWWEPKRNAPAFAFRPIDDVLIPYSASNFYTAERITDVMRFSKSEVEEKIKDGLWRGGQDVNVSDLQESMTKSEKVNEKIEGKVAVGGRIDEVLILEVSKNLDLEGEDPLLPEGGSVPYLVVVEEGSGFVRGLFRNWEPDDEMRLRNEHIVQTDFLVWRGALGIGWPQLLSGLSQAATGALRALLDSAFLQNSQSGVMLEPNIAGRTSGQTIQIPQGGVEKINAGNFTDPDLRKIFQSVPYNQPSGVLFQLLGWLTDAGKGVVSTAEEKIADATNNMPVGTAQALIEQGSKVYANIFGRLHVSFSRMLKILYRLNRNYLDDRLTAMQAGEVLASRRDYQGPCDIIPVSDPRIFSEAQRYAQFQTALSLAQTAPQGLFDTRTLYRRGLEIIRFPLIDEIMPVPPQPHEMDQVSENLAMSQGLPVKAYPGQDHAGHILLLVSFLESPLFGMNPVLGERFIPPALQHLDEHLQLLYAEVSFGKIGMQFGQPLPPEAETALAQQAPIVVGVLGEQFKEIPGLISRCLELMKQIREMQNGIVPQQGDPISKATLDVGLAETARKARKDESDHEIALQKQRVELEKERIRSQTAIEVAEIKDVRADLRIQERDLPLNEIPDIVSSVRD